MKTLKWTKTDKNAWHRLLDVDLRSLDGTGVYVLWHGGFPSRVVHVGYGELSQEFAAQRTDPAVRAFLDYGPLFVTWALVSDVSVAEGISRHLEENLRPLIADGPYSVEPIAVQSPF
ncbi:MAG TPA: hypothetical protein VM240_12465 [Verrucomicrobiae bacterium]|nr:hypothetical protein [Verrucomicrobiae bacterium]